MVAIILENVASELLMRKNITVGLNNPRFVRKAAFHLSPSLILILLYPQITLSLLKYFASFSWSITSLMSSSGVLSLMHTSFNL
jgi:hypothetical protein